MAAKKSRKPARRAGAPMRKGAGRHFPKRRFARTAKIARETFEAAPEEKPAAEGKAAMRGKIELHAPHLGESAGRKIELRRHWAEGSERRRNAIPNAATALLAAGALSAIAGAVFFMLFGTGTVLAAGLASPLFIALSIVLYNRLESGKKA